MSPTSGTYNPPSDLALTFEQNDEYNCPDEDPRYNYCYNVLFYGISQDTKNRLYNIELFEKVNKMIYSWINCKDEDINDQMMIEKAQEYWALRREILKEIHGIILDESGQLLKVER